MESSHIIRRGKIYYFHFRIPKDMKFVYKKNFMRKSLHTDNLKIAEQRVNSLLEFLSLILEKVESNMLTEAQIDSLVEEYINKISDKHNEATALAALPQYDWNENSSRKKLTRYQHMLDNVQHSLEVNDFKAANDFITWVRDDKKVIIEDELENIKLSRTFLQAMSKYLGGILSSSNLNSFNSTANAIPVEKFPIQQEDQVGELFDSFFKEKSTSGAWRENTITDKRSHIDLFIEYFGRDTAVQHITRKHMLEYREKVLKRLPKRRKTNKVVKDLSLEKQLANTSEPKISETTINQYLGTAQGFFDWCLEQNIITRNPVSKLQLQQQTSPHEKRQIYSAEELKNIVTELSKLKLRGENGIKNLDRIWITLLAMFNGFRENEVCQMFIDDFISINGVPCISSTASSDKQTAKTRTSIRTVPIHKNLISLGFLDFINNRRAERDKCWKQRKASKEEKDRQEQLFVTMTYNPIRGNFIKNFLNFYSKFNKNITTNPKKTFHSLRHCFVSKLNNSSNVPYAVSYLVGHAFKTETSKTYTKPDFKILQDELSRLEYDFNIFEIFDIKPLSDKVIAEQVKQLPVKE